MNWYRVASELEDAIYRSSRISRVEINSGDKQMDEYLTGLRDMWARNAKMGTLPPQMGNPEGYVPIYDESVPKEKYGQYRNAIWELMKIVEDTK